MTISISIPLADLIIEHEQDIDLTPGKDPLHMPNLNLEGHTTLYATHGLHSYAAKCLPQLVRYSLRYYLHKITDVNVISRLKRSIGGIDETLWNKLPNLAPGQAIVSATSITRPILTAIDPTPCQLRMVE